MHAHFAIITEQRNITVRAATANADIPVAAVKKQGLLLGARE
jgi:hypothetical protein